MVDYDDELVENNKNQDDDIQRVYKLINIMKYVYQQSIISMEDYYKSSTTLSYKLHISQNEIDKLPYYAYNNMFLYLKDIIERENGGSGVEHEDQFSSMKNQMNSQMSSFKSGMKLPKLK